MNRATDYIGYLSLLWDEDMFLHPMDHPDGPDKELYTDDSRVPKHTRSYAKGGKFDFVKYGLPLWRLDSYLFKRIMVEREAELSALTARPWRTRSLCLPAISGSATPYASSTE